MLTGWKAVDRKQDTLQPELLRTVQNMISYVACNKEKPFPMAGNGYLKAGQRLLGHDFVPYDDMPIKKKQLKLLFLAELGIRTHDPVIGRRKQIMFLAERTTT